MCSVRCEQLRPLILPSSVSPFPNNLTVLEYSANSKHSESTEHTERSQHSERNERSQHSERNERNEPSERTARMFVAAHKGTVCLVIDDPEEAQPMQRRIACRVEGSDGLLIVFQAKVFSLQIGLVLVACTQFGIFVFAHLRIHIFVLFSLLLSCHDSCLS